MLTTSRKSLIVAVIASLGDFDEVVKFPAHLVDLCELRIDLLQPFWENLQVRVEKIPFPKIVTVRDFNEGGSNALSQAARLDLFEHWLPFCNLIDIEFRNLSQFANLVQKAQSADKEIIISFHDFARTPSLKELQGMVDACRLGTAQIFKVATKVTQWSDVETLVHLIQSNPESRIAAMGMGELGKLSRLVLTRLGSCLTYGSIGESVAPGQWPVSELARLLSEI